MNIFFMDVINENAGILFRDGKINTVVAVLFIIFTGIALFLFLMERKVSRLEKKVERMHSADSHKQHANS